MRRLFLVIVLATAGLFATAENINLMTYNLLTNTWETGLQSSRIDRLGQVIKASGADVVAIQELVGSNFNKLKDKSGLTGSFYDISGNNFGNGILWRASMGTPTITNVKILPLEGSSDSSTRSYTVAEFTDFFFISTHFSLNADDRDNMTASIINFANSAGKTVFVAGDFNAAPNFRAMLTFQSNNFVILNDLSVLTFPSDVPTALIDMVLVFRKNETDINYSLVSRGIPTPPAGISLSAISDHLPYNVTINLGNTEPDELVVTSTVDDVAITGTLPWCISRALAGETIHFNVDATELTLSTAINKSLIIDGLNQFPGKKERMVLKKLQPNKFADLLGTTLTLKNLILEGENLAGAIGITADNASTLNIDNCVLRNINSNGSSNNGGACRIQGTANIKNSLFENNTQGTGTYGGGAICIYNSANVTVENSSFIGNVAVEGGAIVATGTVATGFTLKVSNCTFANNIAARDAAADQRGGAVYLKGPTATESNITFINCTFTGNSAAKNGGALCAFASAGKKININLINSLLIHNMSAGNKYSDIDVWNINDRVYFLTATNCIYAKLFGTGVEAGITWTNSINPINTVETNIFFQKETWMTTFERPIITEIMGQKVALLSAGSIAKNAGVANLTGYTIPTLDQLGENRTGLPAIGAVEFNSIVSTGFNQTINANNIQLKRNGSQLSFSGLNGETEMSVFGLTGNLLGKKMVNNNLVIVLDNYNINFVIVKVQNQSFKVLLK